jgi:hypothetical protein
VTHSGLSGRFIDSEDAKAMEEWARGMCRGIKIDHAAKELDAEPTVPAVAKALIGNISENASVRAAALSSCEVELRKANG